MSFSSVRAEHLFILHLNKNIFIFLLVLPAISLFSNRISADESHIRYVLLNDDKVIAGEVLNFYGGFLYLKQDRHILKISPAHFKGIFSSNDDAHQASLTFKNAPNLKPVSKSNVKSTFKSNSEILKILPRNQLQLIYKKAKALNSDKQAVKKLAQETNEKLTEPEDILDNVIFNNIATLAVIADKHHLKDNITRALQASEMKGIINELSPQVRTGISARTQAIYYLLEHPIIETEE